MSKGWEALVCTDNSLDSVILKTLKTGSCGYNSSVPKCGKVGKRWFVQIIPQTMSYYRA